MTDPIDLSDLSDQAGPNDLLLVRRLKAPRALVWRCWTDPALLPQWFCPKPWYVSDAVVELFPGGRFRSTMHGPNGEEFPNEGMVLEAVPRERLVFTDLMSAGFRPSDPGFFTAVIKLYDHPGGGTHYSALAMHRTPADRQKHVEMGFEGGWGTAADQLDALALTLK